ncbi:putative F-box protein At5g44220 [Capsella rubella]|uniref:putative F-box protein At5g44220 n=1 Tax=Capsella rubella TaxID=81985 RepID=UPI000CD5361B|nr:putative F-box protein At5g44220 [Capsella rubella]
MSDSTNEAVMESASSASSPIKRRKISDGTKLPMDMIMEILKRVPVETLGYWCVSKPLASIIRNRHFKKLFLAHSSSRPGRFFVSFGCKDGCHLLSSPLPNQTHPGEEGDTLSVAATYHMKLPSRLRKPKASWIHGLICYESFQHLRSTLKVYNSTTRRSTTLPDFDEPRSIITHMLGYDPVDGVYKVLRMSSRNDEMAPQVPKRIFEVLTLGDDHSTWKMIQECPCYMPFDSHICIDGVLYYYACVVDQGLEKEAALVSFDLRSEKFGLIRESLDCPLEKKKNLGGKV